VGEISISRDTAAVWRRYDRVARVPDGLVVFGDALCHLNPLYGQGMTVAALQALALRDCLRAGRSDIARRFYGAAAEHIEPVWAANRANDREPVPDSERTLKHRLRAWTQRAALTAAGADIAVAERFLRVRSLIDPPARLQEPSLFARILLVNVRRLMPGLPADSGSPEW
jgi:2-polyprenyl-6-methoxyphenol hydroxylase-like FAD-dependent oxidoreductase